ncbi:MAG TPA: hypothetical protein DIW31_01910 [Bacteroidales bacterium]|nr:hypothetical protein [Bacteroidales bacterium]
MKQLFFSLLLLFISINSYSQIDNLEIQIPSAESECEYVWQNIKDIKFFEANGYSLSLPRHEFIDNLLEKSRNNSLSTHDFDSLKALMSQTVYQRNNYLKGQQIIVETIPTIQKAIAILSEIQLKWNFVQFPKYQIALTLYGPGGSYDPDLGRILLQTTTNGSFKGYNSPANTIIHEIVHIGIESSIIKKYNLSHTQKERIVDKTVQILFGDLLSDYKLQGFGDSRIDKYLKSKDDFINLPSIIEAFLAENK